MNKHNFRKIVPSPVVLLYIATEKFIITCVQVQHIELKFEYFVASIVLWNTEFYEKFDEMA